MRVQIVFSDENAESMIEAYVDGVRTTDVDLLGLCGVMPSSGMDPGFREPCENVCRWNDVCEEHGGEPLTVREPGSTTEGCDCGDPECPKKWQTGEEVES